MKPWIFIAAFMIMIWAGGSLVAQSLDEKTSQGKSYIMTSLAEAVADDAVYDMLIQTGPKAVTMSFFGSCGGASHGFLYEGTTVSSAGSALVATNLNRPSGFLSAVTFTHTPTVSGLGTQIGVALIPGDSKKGEFGAETSGKAGFLLKPSTIYLLRIINKSSAPIDIVSGAVVIE